MNRAVEKILKDLYNTHIDSLYRYAYFKMQSNEEEIFDILQEVFYKLWIELADWKQIENPKAYLYRSVSNKIIDYYRKKTPVSLEKQLEENWNCFASSWDIENITHAKLEVEKIYRILAWLSDFEKDIFLLRYIEELTPKEISQRLDINVNSLTVRLHRLKDKIKSYFDQIK